MKQVFNFSMTSGDTPRTSEGKQQRCNICPRSKDRKTKELCRQCKKPSCKEHSNLFCVNCIDMQVNACMVMPTSQFMYSIMKQKCANAFRIVSRPIWMPYIDDRKLCKFGEEKFDHIFFSPDQDFNLRSGPQNIKCEHFHHRVLRKHSLNQMNVHFSPFFMQYYSFSYFSGKKKRIKCLHKLEFIIFKSFTC